MKRGFLVVSMMFWMGVFSLAGQSGIEPDWIWSNFKNKVKSITVNRDKKTQFQYKEGRIVESFSWGDKSQSVTTYFYTDTNKTDSTISAGINEGYSYRDTSRNTYNELGQLTKMQLGSNQNSSQLFIDSFAYNANGQIVGEFSFYNVIDSKPDGKHSWSLKPLYTTIYQYDEQSRLVCDSSLKFGISTSKTLYEYDAQSRLKCKTIMTKEGLKSKYFYSPTGLLTESEENLGEARLGSMKGEGEWVSKSSFKYNKKGLIVKEVKTLYTIKANGKVEKTDRDITTTKYRYY